MIRRHPLAAFVLASFLALVAAVSFIQSPAFARVFKQTLQKYLPRDLGVEGNFADFSIKVFPPGFSVNRPEVTLRERNVLGLPKDSYVKAERVDIAFKIFQVFAGSIRIDQITVIGGEVRLKLIPGAEPKTPKKAKALSLRWDDLLSVRLDAIQLERTHVDLVVGADDRRFEIDAPLLRIARETVQKEDGYRLEAKLDRLRSKIFDPIFAEPEVGGLSLTALALPGSIDFSRIQFASNGLVISGSGKLVGNVLAGTNLKLESDLTLETRSKALHETLAPKLAKKFDAFKDVAQGVQFKGKVSFEIARIVETLQLDGHLKASQVAYQGWIVDRLDAHGRFAGGELSLEKAVLESDERARGAPHHYASGGKVELGPLQTRLPLKETLSVPVRFENAQLQWLVAGVGPAIYPLLGKISGSFQSEIHPGKQFSVKSDVNLAIKDFQLDNQRLGKSIALKKTLHIAQGQIQGPIEIDSNGVTPRDLKVSLPRSALIVNGKIDFKTGLDFHGKGFVELEDVGEIAESPIRGRGELDVHVVGKSPAIRLDFNSKIEDAEYLNLKLGALEGLIRWDDEPSKLIFSNITLKHPGSEIKGNGVLDLGQPTGKESIDLKLTLGKSDINPIIGVFEKLTASLDWLPRTLNGPTAGTITVQGGLDLDALQVLASLQGRDWEYRGERFKSVALNGGFDRGNYVVRDFVATKQSGQMSGRIRYDKNSILDWSLETRGFSLGDWNLLTRLDVPVRGRMLIRSEGKGVYGKIQSNNEILIDQTSVRGVPYLPSELRWTTERGQLKATGTLFGGQATLDLLYGFDPGVLSRINLQAKDFDFSPLLLLINPSLMKDKAFVGRLSGAIQNEFKSSQFELGTGIIDVKELHLSRSGREFKTLRPLRVGVQSGSFSIQDWGLVGPSGKLGLKLESTRGAWSGRVSGGIDASLAEFFTSVVSSAQGLIQLDAQLGGSLKAPKISGTAEINRASIYINSIESSVENLTGVATLRDGLLSIRRLDGDLSGGRVTAQGTIEVFSDRVPELALRVGLVGPRLKVYPFQYAKIRGQLFIEGKEIPYLIRGGLVIDQALSREKVMSGRKSAGLKAISYLPPPTAGGEGARAKFKLDLAVQAERGILIQNDLFDAEFKGKLSIVNTIETPRILGSAELVSGKLFFKDHQFQMLSAGAKFDNPTTINPQVNLTAATEVQGTRIQLFASGRLDTLKLELSSNPVMSEGEILTLLTLGMTSSQAQRLSAQDRQLVEQGEAASLLLHSLDFNREVQNKTGIQIQLDQSVNALTGMSAFRPQTPTDAAAPKIVVRKQIGKKFDVSYGSTVGVGTNSQRQVNAEYQVTPRFSVIGVWDNFQTVETNDNRTSYGLDLKVQRRFK